MFSRSTIIGVAAASAIGGLVPAASADRIEGVWEGDRTGHSVRNVGDIDGDGVNDFIVGSPGYREGRDQGRADLYSGADCRRLWNFAGEARGDQFGWDCTGYAFFNGNARQSFICVSAPYNDERAEDAGKIYIFWDWDGTDFREMHTITGRKEGDRFGYALGAADVDGDRWIDIIVGAPYNDKRGRDAGAAYVYSGRDHRRLARHFGEDAGDRFGFDVAGVGNCNGDRMDEYIVGAPRHTRNRGKKKAGRAYVFEGGSYDVLYTINGKRKGDKLGTSVAGIGRANDDRFDDFAAASPNYDAGGRKNTGRVEAFSGRNGRRLWGRNGGNPQDRFGREIAWAGDVDRDGFDDCMIGAHRWDYRDGNRTEADAGKIYVRSGPNGRPVTDVFAGRRNMRLGTALANLGDLHRDGRQFALLGVPQYEGRGLALIRPWNLPPNGPSPARDGGPGLSTGAGADDLTEAEPSAPTQRIVDLLAAVGQADESDTDLDDDGFVDLDDLMIMLGADD